MTYDAYRSKSTNTIVSKTAYLIGVREDRFYDEEIENRYYRKELFQELDQNKAARILRNLCILRTDFIMNAGRIKDAMRANVPIDSREMFEIISLDALEGLKKDGIRLPNLSRPYDYIIEFNRLISDRVNNIKNIYPTWIPWEYIRGIFVMPNGLSEDGVRTAMETYAPNKNIYPFQRYINWRPADEGNILHSDWKFLPVLYRQHFATFDSFDKISLPTDSTLKSIEAFLLGSKKAVVVVDCENSDPYRMYSAIASLEDALYNKIGKIVLFNDANTSSAWDILGEQLEIPVETKQIERVLNRKSLVDIALTAHTCREFYSGVDSFIIVSSDSDYWGLIKSLPEARFMMMMERESCSPAIREQLELEGITYCFTEDFPFEMAKELKDKIVRKELKAIIDGVTIGNMNEMIQAAMYKAYAKMNDAEIADLKKTFQKGLKICIDEEGNIMTSLCFNK